MYRIPRHCTQTRRPPMNATMPNPVMRRPGSMPRMRRSCVAEARTFGNAALRFKDGVGVDVLHIVKRLDRVDELLHSRRILARHLDIGRGLHRHFGELGLESGLDERV